MWLKGESNFILDFFLLFLEGSLISFDDLSSGSPRELMYLLGGSFD